ncbi:MAG: Co2+/Mg2+ efflux protein ApaG [Pseudomonadota bacterium]
MILSLFPYVAQTHGVIVRVSANFLPEQSRPAQERWFWAYHIRIENEGPLPVQLLTRHWEIRDAHGELHVVEGDGVIGEQPVIRPGASYDYVSGCPLSTSSGSMVGRYRMMDEAGTLLDIAIPAFDLRTPVVSR